MFRDDLACGVTLALMEAREGFHGLRLDLLFLPSRRLAGERWRNEVLLRAERYHSRIQQV
jgi:hypothetical protein